MNAQNIKRAFEARQNAVHELQKLADECEGRDMSAEEEATYRQQNEAIDTLDGQIREGLDLIKREQDATAALDEFRSYGDLTAVATETADAKTINEDEVFRQLLRGEIRSFESKGERRDLTVGTASAGGNLVTSTLYDRVIDKLEEEGVALAAGATLIQTESGEDILVPAVSGHSSGALVAEGGSIGESDPSFSSSTLSTFKFAAIVEVSRELIEDQGVGSFNVLDFVADQGGAAVGRTWSQFLSTGTGSSQPQGFTLCTTGKTAASATAITADEIIDLQHSVISPYRANAAWAMKDSTLAAVRKLKDGNSAYLWQPSIQLGAPDTLLGAPVYTDTNMAAIATGNTTIVYGDFGKGYIARVAGGVQIDSTNAAKFSTDLISVRFIVRGGGVIADTSALRKLVQA